MANFKDIIGQEQIKEHLQMALSSGKISHAYIINGERFAGKEFIAKILPWRCSVKRAEQGLAASAIPVSRHFRTTIPTSSV